jgi:UDP-glucuronate 4-epimerase
MALHRDATARYFMRFLITGTAGFIGFHLARRLLEEGNLVVGLDGLTPYYDLELKRRRHAILAQYNGFCEERVMLDDQVGLKRVWEDNDFDAVIHLAAQVGVRYSSEAPSEFVAANLIGTFNIMELIRGRPVKHFMFASSSSVYGASFKEPFSEIDICDQPLSFYAATKKSCELMAHSYSHLWDIPTTAFRFFTVYGPWGRPDMALSKFTRRIIEGKPIDIYNHGHMERDFIYIDDLIEAIIRLAQCAPSRLAEPTPRREGEKSPSAPFRVVNIGGGRPVGLMSFVAEIEKNLGKTAIRNMLPMQASDVPTAFACVDFLEKLTGYRPSTSLATGVEAFVKWHRSYYNQ